MASSRSTADRVRRRLKVLKRPIYKAATEVDASPDVSCTRGCTGCCHQVVGTSIAEAVELLRVSDPKWWEENKKKVEWRAMRWVLGKVTRRSWMASNIPCVFLVDKECSAYENRPVTCASYAVVSPPENCFPDSEDSEVAFLDMNPVSVPVAFEILKFSKEVGIVPALMPMSVALMLGQGFIEGGQEGLLKAAKSMGLPDDPRELYGALYDLIPKEEKR